MTAQTNDSKLLKYAGKRENGGGGCPYLESAADGSHRLTYSFGDVGEVVVHSGLRVVVAVKAVGAEGVEEGRLAGL